MSTAWTGRRCGCLCIMCRSFFIFMVCNVLCVCVCVRDRKREGGRHVCRYPHLLTLPHIHIHTHQCTSPASTSPTASKSNAPTSSRTSSTTSSNTHTHTQAHPPRNITKKPPSPTASRRVKMPSRGWKLQGICKCKINKQKAKQRKQSQEKRNNKKIAEMTGFNSLPLRLVCFLLFTFFHRTHFL